MKVSGKLPKSSRARTLQTLTGPRTCAEAGEAPVAAGCEDTYLLAGLGIRRALQRRRPRLALLGLPSPPPPPPRGPAVPPPTALGAARAPSRRRLTRARACALVSRHPRARDPAAAERRRGCLGNGGPGWTQEPGRGRGPGNSVAVGDRRERASFVWRVRGLWGGRVRGAEGSAAGAEGRGGRRSNKCGEGRGAGRGSRSRSRSRFRWRARPRRERSLLSPRSCAGSGQARLLRTRRPGRQRGRRCPGRLEATEGGWVETPLCGRPRPWVRGPRGPSGTLGVLPGRREGGCQHRQLGWDCAAPPPAPPRHQII